MEVAKPKLVVDVSLESNSKPRWTLADAILADLEMSATPRNIYESKWETHTTTEQATVSSLGSRVSTLNRSLGSCSPDAALPALPSDDNSDVLLDPREYYRTRSPGQPVYSSTIMISKSVYDPNENEEEYHRSQSVSPGPSRFNQVSQYTKSQHQSSIQDIQRLSPPNASKPTRLSDNLSELDSLLDDLNSGKLYADVDRTSQNAMGNHRISPQTAGTLRSQPDSRSGTLQRDKEIPKLIVSSLHPNTNYGNYDDSELCRSSGLQGPYVQQQNSAASYSQVSGMLQNRSNGVRNNVVPTNVQQPPVRQLQHDLSGDQFQRDGGPSPTFQMQKLQQQQQPMQQPQQRMQQLHLVQAHQVQRSHPTQLSDAPAMQQRSQGQTMTRPQGQGQETYDTLGQGNCSQTITEHFTTEERVINQPSQSVVSLPPQQHFTNQTTMQQQPQPLQQHQQQQQQQQLMNEMSLRQQPTGQPLQPVEQHRKVVIHETVTKRVPPGSGVPREHATSASKDLENLMASFSEFDLSKGGALGGDALYAQPVKTVQVPVVPTGQASGDSADAAEIRNSQERSQGGYLSVSSSGRGDYDGGNVSPSPRETTIHRSPSTLGQPVPSTVYSQDQGSSKVVVTQGMHGILPPGNGGGQAGDGQLEAMLSQMGSDLSRQGVLTLPKGDCVACNRPIVGQVLMALGKIWHPEHFRCVHCKQGLGTNTFFERDGQPYCENDYQVLFSPKCALCGEAILEKCITALNKTWHPEHFFCAQCQRPFGDEGFHEQNGMPYCRDDYFSKFAPKCGGCGRAILNNYFTALQRQWHPECFVCRECYAPFESGSFFDHNGLPYCEQHFHAQRGSLCATCQQPIMGRCITAMYRKFHPEHFVCVFCLQPLNKGTFKEHGNKSYCHQCFERLFG